MDELISTLKFILDSISNEWVNEVLVDNNLDISEVNSYNLGVEAMANHARAKIASVILAKIIEFDLKEGDK